MCSLIKLISFISILISSQSYPIHNYFQKQSDDRHIAKPVAKKQSTLPDFLKAMNNVSFSSEVIQSKNRWAHLKKLYDTAKSVIGKTRSIPYRFHLICLNQSVPQKIYALINRIKELHPQAQVTLWTLKDVATFPFFNRTAFNHAVTLDQKIDILRLEILYKYGGIFIDSNFELLKPIDDLLSLRFFCSASYSRDAQLYTALMGSIPAHSVVRCCLDTLSGGSDRSHPMKKIGNEHFTDCFFYATKYSQGYEVALPVNFFYPIPPFDSAATGTFVSPHSLPSYSYALHHWKRNDIGTFTYWPKPRGTSPAVIPDEKPFVIITLTYNNESYCVHNLKLALEQDYSNFRIILINDNSSDDTELKISDFLQHHPQAYRVTYVKTDARRRAMANHLAALSLCNENEIAVHYDGDDFFANKQVLHRLNQEYKDPDTWMTWGSYVNLSNHSMGFSQPLPASILAQNAVRRYTWVTSHLRTFYVWLARKINPRDMHIKNQPLPTCCDLGFMFPMIEMAGSHAHYISDILLHYNDINQNNIFKTAYNVSRQVEGYLRNIVPYPHIKDRKSVVQR